MSLRVRRHEKGTGSQPFRLDLRVNHDGTVRLTSCEDCTGTHEDIAAVLRRVADNIEAIGRGEHE